MTGRPLACEDELAALRLYGRYAHAYDRGDPEAFAALFTETGQFAVGASEPVCGREALAAMAAAAAQRDGTTMHITTNIVLEAAAGGAVGTASVLVVRAGGDALHVVTIGRYEDELDHSTGEWLFQRRVFEPTCDPSLAGALLARRGAP